MRDVPETLLNTWISGDAVGDRRPMCRVTVQKANTRLYQHTFPIMRSNPATTQAGGVHMTAMMMEPLEKETESGSTTYASTVFGSAATPQELPNLKSVSWSRSVDNDAAEATFVFYNSAPLKIGEYPARDELGFYTFNRGDAQGRWGHTPNQWANMLMPDNVLRTYEGYGFDANLIPEKDPFLVQTGVWLIDQVDVGTDGLITVSARDYARLLFDHIAMLPVIPPDFYPLSFTQTEKVSGDHPATTYRTPITIRNEEATDIGVITQVPHVPHPPRRRVALSLGDCSDYRYDPKIINYTVIPGDYLIKIAAKFKVLGGWRAIAALNQDVFEARGDKPKSPHWIYPGQVLRVPITDPNQYGHEASDAFDNDKSTYWLSHGFNDGSQSTLKATEWIQGKLPKVSLSQIRFTLKGSGYAVYVSVRSNGAWVGSKRVPYTSGGVDLQAGIPYAALVNAGGSNTETVVNLDRQYTNVDAVRLSFRNLALLSSRRRVAVAEFTAWANNLVQQKPKIIPTLPGYRGISDAFDRVIGTNYLIGLGNVWIIGSHFIGKTPQGDRWYSNNYMIKPKGVCKRRKYAVVTNPPADCTNEKAFPLSIVDLKVREQTVTIRTLHQPSTNDSTVQRSRGRWMILLRGTGGVDGIKVYVDHQGAIEVWQLTYTWSGNQGTPVLERIATVAADTTNFLTDAYDVVASILGTQLSVGVRIKGSTDEFINRLTINDKRFAASKGTFAGFATGNYSSCVDQFSAKTVFRQGVRDSFDRRNNAVLGKADSGQVWRHPDNTWKVNTKDAFQTRSTTQRPLALIDLYDSDQDVKLDVSGMGTNGEVIIALRAANPANVILVRFRSNVVSVDVRSGGKSTTVTTKPISITQWPVKLRATIINATVTIYVDGAVVHSHTALSYADPALSYHCGFGSNGYGARLRGFSADCLGAADTWTYIAETTVPARFEPGAGAKPGTYEDYTDIVKLLCAWGGFYWPKDGQLANSDGTFTPLRPQKTDAVLGRSPEVGRVWGDFETSGTAGKTSLNMDIWDKKTLMDGINYVRDILGFIFYIDELGGVVWRQPNIFNVGNNVSSFSSDPRRTAAMYTLDEKVNLLDLKVALNSSNVRERVFIGNVSGTLAGMAKGFNPNPTGLRRVTGWTDQNFATQEECQVMANLITIRQAFRYRTNQISILGFPGIQIDDQVRVWDETTAETYIHYVRGINSTLDLEAGQYQYELTTHWLGNNPPNRWLFNANQFKEETRAWLDELALKSGIGSTNYYELPRKDTDKIPVIPPSPDGATQIIEVIR